MPELDYPTEMRIRVLVGSILSVAVIGSALLLSTPPGRAEASGVRLASQSAPLTVDTSTPLQVVTDPPMERSSEPGSTSGAPATGLPRSSSIDPSYVRAAKTCPGLDPTVLAAIHTIETRKGKDHRVSSAGAVGPMQFLPSTWSHYGIDGNGDGRADIRNFSDALFSAAGLLCANGGGDVHHLPGAIWNYNHSQGYVADVLGLAAQLSTS